MMPAWLIKKPKKSGVQRPTSISGFIVFPLDSGAMLQIQAIEP
jgi:hypothetical protein